MFNSKAKNVAIDKTGSSTESVINNNSVAAAADDYRSWSTSEKVSPKFPTNTTE